MSKSKICIKYVEEHVGNELGRKILEYCNDNHCTIASLAPKIGITRQSVYNHINDDHLPPFNVFFAYAYIMNKDPYKLYDECNKNSI